MNHIERWSQATTISLIVHSSIELKVIAHVERNMNKQNINMQENPFHILKFNKD